MYWLSVTLWSPPAKFGASLGKLQNSSVPQLPKLHNDSLVSIKEDKVCKSFGWDPGGIQYVILLLVLLSI